MPNVQSNLDFWDKMAGAMDKESLDWSEIAVSAWNLRVFEASSRVWINECKGVEMKERDKLVWTKLHEDSLLFLSKTITVGATVDGTPKMDTIMTSSDAAFRRKQNFLFLVVANVVEALNNPTTAHPLLSTSLLLRQSSEYKPRKYLAENSSARKSAAISVSECLRLVTSIFSSRTDEEWWIIMERFQELLSKEPTEASEMLLDCSVKTALLAGAGSLNPLTMIMDEDRNIVIKKWYDLWHYSNVILSESQCARYLMDMDRRLGNTSKHTCNHMRLFLNRGKVYWFLTRNEKELKGLDDGTDISDHLQFCLRDAMFYIVEECNPTKVWAQALSKISVAEVPTNALETSFPRFVRACATELGLDGGDVGIAANTNAIPVEHAHKRVALGDYTATLNKEVKESKSSTLDRKEEKKADPELAEDDCLDAWTGEGELEEMLEKMSALLLE